MYIRNKQDFWSGLTFVALGLGFAYQATSYQVGTAANLGPGYFPFWLGMCLALMGAIVTSSSLRLEAARASIDKFNFKVLGIIIASIFMFGIMLPSMGLYLSLFILVVLSSLASHEFSLGGAIATAIFLVVFCWLAFIKGLGLIFPQWPFFLG